MMIQNAPPGEPRFIGLMAEHNDLCGQFARAFGNERFQRIEPYEEMLYVVSHHDRGWDERDANPILDPNAGVPFGIGGGPALDGRKIHVCQDGDECGRKDDHDQEQAGWRRAAETD